MPLSHQICNVTPEKLLSVAQSFHIDPLINVTVEKRSKNTWVILQSGSTCLNKNGEWESEASPSNRTENFINQTRFDSLMEAIEFFLDWRSERYFVCARFNADRRWFCFGYSKSRTECQKMFNDMINAHTKHGRCILVAPDRTFIEDQVGESGKKVEFIDFPG